MISIAIASGKGGTGKTFVATNIARTLENMGRRITYLDCDVEEPNGHLFLRPDISKETDIEILSPLGVDNEKCIGCGKCARACNYNAIAMIRSKVIFFPELCHICGACSLVCPADAIVEGNKRIGTINEGHAGNIDFTYAELETGEGGMSPRLIQRVKQNLGEGINILDCPPGTACPAVESIIGADLVVLITDPTPFGVHDLKLAVNMCREMNIEPVVLVNRADYLNQDLKTYCREAELKIIGEIPDDRKVAELYSDGGLVVDQNDEYKAMFLKLAEILIKEASQTRAVKAAVDLEYSGSEFEAKELRPTPIKGRMGSKSELVIISGKGGTGKTSLAACFAALDDKPVIADCDVDAADMHLITQPLTREKGIFTGGVTARIDTNKCTKCGICKNECRFGAVDILDGHYRIDPFKCEGCGVCKIVCQEGAIITEKARNGEWYISDTRLGPMAHARLGLAEENTGRLVSLVREKAQGLEAKGKLIVIDGAPGTGCPVIASLTGSTYAVVVTEPTVSGIHDMKRVMKVAEHFGIRGGVIVNKCDLNPKNTHKIWKIADEMGFSFLGEIPYDGSFTEAQMEGKSLVEHQKGPTTNKIREIWHELKKEIY